MKININIFELLDIYFLVIVVINGFVAFFIDSSFYEKKSDMKMRLRAKVLSVLSLIIGIALYISGQMLGGI